ncbi:serine/threonine-protein phosphatase 6 regulatory ankyrin repeat subunit A-like [Haliotis rufescens]|uniref:serine/threonine-protein phosphatase 6 regulatory ankyrin repeat subunit A-like n=1 Tax=Haliotis rufescens TaxID=6454 RepID=UPI00201EE6F6|nr:serine/threonine-protein phosphatase 6 regulatory ankyrin repeat subunit A-like [Haliotis rufescens]
MASIDDHRGPIAIHIHSNATHINAAGIVHGGVGNVLEQRIRKEVAARLGSSQAIENETSDAVRSSQAIENETSDAVRSSQAIENETSDAVRSLQAIENETSDAVRSSLGIESSAQGIRKKATATVGCLQGAETTSSGAESGQTNRTETTATLGRVDDIGRGPPARVERGHVIGTGTASGVGSGPGTGRAQAGGGGSGQHTIIAEGCGQYNRHETTVYKQVSNDQRTEANGEASESIHTTLGAGQHGKAMTKSSSDKRQTDIDFHAACKAGDVGRVARLLSGDQGNLNGKDGNGRTGLMMAAYQGHRDVVEYLVSKGADLTLVEKGGDTILHAACRGGDINIVKCVLSKDDVDVNCTDKSGMTPSMSAARWGYTEVVKLLFRRGSNLQMVDDEGDTVLHYACRGGHDDIAEYVLHCNTALINVKNRSGKTAARVAKDEEHYLVYEHLKSVHSGCYLM